MTSQSECLHHQPNDIPSILAAEAKMSWSLKAENDCVFVFINGRKVVNMDTGEEFGPVETIDHGKMANELWIHFRGCHKGRRVLRSNFHTSDETFQNLERASSNGDFFKALKPFAITQRKKSSARQKHNRDQLPMPSSSSIDMPADTSLTYEVEIIREKRAGDFRVSIDRLSMAPKEYRCREVDEEWVNGIKTSIREAPGQIISKIPVLLDPDMISDPSNFNEETMEDGIQLFLLGGNHLVSACKELLLEEPNNKLFDSYRFLQVEAFIGLTPEEAKLVGNIHSARSRNKEINFQDQVRQVRGIFLRDEIGDKWKETATIVLSHLQQKVCKRDSLNVVFSVASYDACCFAEVDRLFALWGNSDFPPKLFKALMGLSSDVVLQHLKRIQTPKEVHPMTNTIRMQKKRDILRKIFQERTNCETWEEAEENFEPYIHVVEKFLDMNINRRYIPADFIKACDRARDNLPLREINVTATMVAEMDGEELQGEEVEAIIGSVKRQAEDKLKQRLEKKIKI